MQIVVGVSLRVAGKIYLFDPGTESYYRGEHVLVETARGVELGIVRQPPHEVPEDQIVQPLKRVLGHASDDDLDRDDANREREAYALSVCKRLVQQLNLPMRLIDAQLTFDGTHILINFQAENRVDFRELVRELARDLHTRIELRQVGVRDEAKLLDGYGMCGRRLCCSAFLTNFAPVAINMAKAQGLALNPQKISGNCGRLMCCLAFEYELYSEMRMGMPKMNARIDTPRGEGKVTKVNALNRQVEVTFPDDDTPVWFTMEELHGEQPVGCGHACGECAGHLETERVLAAAPTVASEPVREPQDEQTESSEEQRPRRNRHRRGRGGGTLAQAPAQEGQPAPAKAPDTADPAAGPNNAARRRRRPRRDPVGDGQTAPPPDAPPPGGEAPSGDAKPKFPPGRYRPRRR